MAVDKKNELTAEQNLNAQFRILSLQQTHSEWLETVKAGYEVAKAYDQVIITISAAAIALCSSIIGRESHPPADPQKTLLYISMGLFFIAVLFTMFSFFFGKASFKNHQKELMNDFARLNNEVIVGAQEQRDKRVRTAFLTEICNYVSGFSFIIGIILVSVSFIQ